MRMVLLTGLSLGSGKKMKQGHNLIRGSTPNSYTHEGEQVNICPSMPPRTALP